MISLQCCVIIIIKTAIDVFVLLARRPFRTIAAADYYFMLIENLSCLDNKLCSKFCIDRRIMMIGTRCNSYVRVGCIINMLSGLSFKRCGAEIAIFL